ncbi:MAG: TIGR03936 family radical SAM-associated protein [Sporomusaceae bacterium]|jgi:radical SAM-linked protein|nr:TIGR03936 family radical SAM-associated protein [Sporomusaceae bacterium]
MARVRLKLTKGEEVRYLSHLDYVKAVERALRRSQLPVAYSEGFNPHLKLSFASALAVGVTSDGEYIDAELTQEMDLKEFAAKLAPCFGKGIQLITAAYVAKSSPALTASLNLAEYEAALFYSTEMPRADAAAALEKFNTAASILFTKKTPKGSREIDLKNFLAQPLKIAPASQAGQLILNLAIKMTPTGSAKPADVLTALAAGYGFPATDAVLINRTGLYIEKNGKKILPIDFVH